MLQYAEKDPTMMEIPLSLLEGQLMKLGSKTLEQALLLGIVILPFLNSASNSFASYKGSQVGLINGFQSYSPRLSKESTSLEKET